MIFRFFKSTVTKPSPLFLLPVNGGGSIVEFLDALKSDLFPGIAVLQAIQASLRLNLTLERQDWLTLARRKMEVIHYFNMGLDMLQPIEAPPEGDMTMAEATRRIGEKFVIEGNVQISRFTDQPPEAFGRLVAQTVAEGKRSRRFVLCPTASPYSTEISDRVVQNYLTFIDVALAEGGYD